MPWRLSGRFVIYRERERERKGGHKDTHIAGCKQYYITWRCHPCRRSPRALCTHHNLHSRELSVRSFLGRIQQCSNKVIYNGVDTEINCTIPDLAYARAFKWHKFFSTWIFLRSGRRPLSSSPRSNGNRRAGKRGRHWVRHLQFHGGPKIVTFHLLLISVNTSRPSRSIMMTSSNTGRESICSEAHVMQCKQLQWDNERLLCLQKTTSTRSLVNILGKLLFIFWRGYNIY